MKAGRYANKAGMAAAAVIAFFTTLATAQTPASTAATPTPPPPPPPAPVLTPDQASYDFGMTFGEQLRHAGLNEGVNTDSVMRGLKDSLGGKKLTPADQQQLSTYIRNVRETAGVRNKNAAKAFLAANGQLKDVKTTASGLQYKVITPGDVKAASPHPDDTVTVQYRGKLLDGTEFDSSYSRGQPATMQANRVIRGWQEALSLMKPGSKYQLFIPPELGYDMGSPPGIPPGSLLIFDVELLSVQAAPAAGAPGADAPTSDAAKTDAPKPKAKAKAKVAKPAVN